LSKVRKHPALRFSAALALIVCVLLLQVAAAAHRIDHHDTPKSTVCALCIAAGHSSAPPPAEIVVAIPVLEDVPLKGCAKEPAASPPDLLYDSRAPPRSF
jgi:hypothetical protein